MASVAAIATILVLHYTSHGSPVTHAVLRRLAYLPIGILAVRHGVTGGTAAGAAVALLYLPHAFFAAELSGLLGTMVHADPSSSVDKISELVIYVVLGALLGVAVDANRKTKSALGDAQRDLTQTTQDLHRAERLGALGELAAGIAHEVRNPLTALRTTAEVLAEAYPQGHARHRMAQLHLSELDRLDVVVQKFLDFARPKPLAVSPAPVTPLFEQVAALLQTTARDAAVEVKTAESAELSWAMDKDLMAQVLLNLGLNAIQHSSRGAQVCFSAELSAGSTPTLTLHVDDEGRGIDPDVGERIYDPCVTTRAEGSGLGLSVASRIVDAHHGRLTHAPRASGGTRFSVVLPQRPEAA